MSDPHDANQGTQPHPALGLGPISEATFSPPPPPPPPSGAPQVIYAAAPSAGGKSLMGRVFTSLLGMVLVVSLLLNFYLGMIVAIATSGPSVATYLEGDADYRIVILPIEGMIDETTYHTVRTALQEIRKNPPAALILRVDSGGGLVGPSDRIWKEITDFKAQTGIPIIASYGSVAASGGYYVSAMADYIFAEPTCVTGSIGVMANVATFDRLLDKIGVTPEVIVAENSPHKDIANNLLRPWNEQDRQSVQFLLDNAYAQFVTVVYDGRKAHLTAEEVASLANGDVYTAEQAKANKLIDAVGYLTDAVAEAARRAMVPAEVTPLVQIYREKPGLLGMLTSSRTGGASKIGVDLSAVDAQQVRRMVIELSTPRMEYRFGLLHP